MRLPSPTASQALGTATKTYTTKKHDTSVKLSGIVSLAAPPNYSWTITQHSNANDKQVGYQGVLNDMRQFVQNGGTVAQKATITINDGIGGSSGSITLTFTDNNFTVTDINGQAIKYTYPSPLPTFTATNLPSIFTKSPKAVTDSEKAQLIYLFSEAARSEVIETAMENAITNSGIVNLNTYAPFVHTYGHTCSHVGVNSAHPTRTLKCTDYCAYAATLQKGVPDRNDINNICNCKLP
jgi:hypothetical protein